MTIKNATAFLFSLFYWLCCFLGTGTDRKDLAGLRGIPLFAVVAVPAAGIVTGIG